jgi:autotransporter-associated beta strand protein
MISSTNPKVCRNSPVLSWLRRRLKTPVTCLLLGCFTLWSVQSSKAATLTWINGSATWDTSSPFWNPGPVAWNNAAFDTALFTGAPETITLGGPITVGGLTFNSNGYLVTGNTLTLGAPTGFNSPSIAVNNNGFGTHRATISSTLAGTSGFIKTGNGALLLTADNSSTLSGDVAIKGGSVVITNANQLGSTTGTAISVTGIANTVGATGGAGFTGGALVLQGTTNGASATTGTVTLNRELSLAGRGPGANNLSGSLVSIGYNTLSGGLTLGNPASQARAWASHGTTTIGGGMFLGGGVGDAVAFQGNGNWNISGLVSGVDASADRFLKLGNLIGTTLWLQNANNTYAQTTRIDSGTVRVAVNGALGTNTSTGQVDFNGGTLEVRTDAASGFAGRTVRYRNNTSGTIFVDHDLSGGLGIGTSLQNQTVTFGGIIRDAGANNVNFNYNGRNGYNLTFSSALPAVGDHRAWTINNNTSGTLTYTGNVWNTNRTPETGTFTVQGNAETVITGSVIASGAAHILTKAGSGTFTFGGTASTYTGNTNITAGTLAFSDVGAFANSALINIGNATTGAGTLTYTGAAATLTKPIRINVTTGNTYINASGTGALTLSPTTLTNGVGAGGAHTIFFGGSSTANNTLTTAISAGVAGITSIQKIGTGTWVLAPTASNAFTGSTTIGNGILRITDGAAIDLLPDAGAVIFGTETFTQAAGGTLNYIGGANTETVGALTATAGQGTVTASSGTLTFASLGARTAGANINVSNTGTVNITGTAGFLNAGTYFNNADFAFSGAGTTLRAPVYGSDAGFVNAGATLTAASHNSVNATIAAQTTVAVNSLKINGANDLTLAGGQTLTVGVGAAPAGAGILLTGGSSTISGGTALAASAAGNDFAIRVNGSGNTLTINTPMTVSTAGLTKSGNGTLTLGGANTFTGTVNVNEGTLKMAAGGLLGTTNIGLNVRQGATFDLNGVSLGSIASGSNSVNALNGAGTITNTGDLAILRVGNNNAAGYFTGAVTGGANTHLVKNGSATLSLTNNTSDFGTLTISAGTVAFALPAGTTTMNAGFASPIGTGATAANLVFNGGTLQYTGANATIFSATQSPSFSTDRQFTLAANGTIQSSGQYGNNVLAGGAQNNASIIFSNTADLAFSGTGARTLTLGGNSIGDNEMRIRLRDNPNADEALAITKADAGLWILNREGQSANTYTGVTTISGGALRAIDGSGLSSSSLLTITAGVLETSGTFSRTLGAAAGNVQLTGGASGFAASSTDRLVVSLGGGAITWGGATFAPTSLVLGSSTALGETEITNAINLGTAARTVTVNNNGNTGTMVTAGILSGVISGGAGGTFTKNGNGVLMLGNQNTYIGNTTISAGTLLVTSLGNNSGTTASSIGASGGSLRFSANADINLVYVGPGEASSRPITFATALTAGRNQRIDSSGSGPLVLSNVSNTNTGAFTMSLDLRGSNTDNNMITSVLGNNGTSILAIAKNDGGTWILNPTAANTFTGSLTVNGGNLGLTANGIGAATAISMGNAGIFAFGGPLTTSAIISGNNATALITGQNSITVGGLTKNGGNNAWTISNNLDNGAVFTVNGNLVNLETANSQTINFRGYGSTVFNGVIQNSSGVATTAINIAIANDASFTFSGTSANTYSNVTTLSQGTLILNKTLGVAQIGTGSQFNFGGGVLRSDAGALTGANALPNNLFLTGNPVTFSGANNIELTGNLTNNAGNRLLINNLSTLTHSGSNFINLSNDATARVLTIAGSGATVISSEVRGAAATPAQGGTLAYSGTGSLLLTGASTTTGSLTVNRGTATLAGASGAWAGTVNLNPTGTLTLDNTASSVNRLADAQAVVGNGGTLNFIGNAAGSSETAGPLNLTNTQSTITMNVTGGTNILTFASLATGNTGSSLDLSSIANLGVVGAGGNQVIFTGANGLINGINPRIFINGGADFATHGVTGVTAFTGYNLGNNFNTALATDTMELTASVAATANRTVNAIKINGTGLTVSGAASNRLTLGAAGILNTGGNNALSVNEVAFGANTGFIQVAPSTTLTVNSDLTGSAGISKVLSGNLNFGTGARSFITSTHNLMGGMVTLNGGADTFFPNQAFNLPTGGILDLNGGGQYVNSLASQSGIPSAGGSVNGGGALVVGSGGGGFSGVISSGTALARVGGGTLTFSTAQSYTGPTLLMAGTTTLENDATILNTSSLDINHAILFLSNNSSLQTQNNDRIADALEIDLRGGTISVTGRVDTTALESLGAIKALEGANTITATTGGGTITSMDLTLASLTRSAGTTVNFTGTNLGQQGNNARIVIASTPTVVGGGVLGAWAIANTTDYAAYNAGLGVGVVGQGGFTGYDAQIIAAANVAPTPGTFATGNITNINSTANSSILLGAGTTTTGLLRIGGGFTTDVNFTNTGDILNLELGGILRSNNNNATTIGTVANRGIITSGTSELVVYNNANTTGATVMTINSSIQGAGTALVKSGAGVLALTGVNTYGGGTTVAQGTLELRGTNTGDVVISAGGLTLINSTVTQFATAVTNPTGQGQINSTNAVTLRGGSALTLTGNNTLSSLAFDNNGGTANPTVTSGGLLILTNATPITVTSSNPSTVATIAGAINIGSGAKTINTPAIQVGGVTVTNIVSTLNISAAILSPGASINKTGNGLLQLSGQSTFTGGVNLNAGGLVIGASSTPAQGGGGITTGPLGSGTLSVAAGRTLLTSGTFGIGNDVTFAGTPLFDATANTAWTLSLNGTINGLADGASPIEIANPGMTVALLGTIPNIASITSFNKTGLGTLIFNSKGYTGNFDANALGNGLAVQLLHDGLTPNVGNGVVETIALPGNVIFAPVGTGTITVNRAGGSLPFNLAANKIISPASINTVLTNGLIVANTSGYGLQVVDSGALVGTPTFTVNTASASNVTQGLYFTGDLSGTGFIKAGAGALVLNNTVPANNTFTGNININQGVVSVNSDAQLGNTANIIQLNPTTGTSTLRATANITTTRTIQLSTASNTRSIEVTGGNTLQLDTAFDVSSALGAALAKADAGTLALNASNPTWTGVLTISQGALNVLNADALGTTAGNTVVSASGAALLLPQAISLAEPLSLVGTGILTGGALQGTGAGTSTQTGAITLGGAAAIGADTGNTLTITGGISGAQALTFVGPGNVSLSTTALGAVTSVTKLGSGTTTLGVNSTAFVGVMSINRGTFAIGSAGAGSVGATGVITVNQNGTLTVDNTVGPVARLGARGITLAGGTLNYNTNSAAPFEEVAGALILNSGASVISMSNAGASATSLRFATLAFGAGGTGNVTGLSATNLLRFTTTPTLTPLGATGLIPRLTVNGNEFATYSGSGATGNVAAFTAYAAATNILSAGATQTFNATPVTANSLTGNQTLNALTLSSGSGAVNVGGLSGLNPTTLTLTSGAILANGSGTTSTLSVPVVAVAGAEAIFHVANGQTLNVTSGFSGTAGMTKSLNGTLNLNSQQFVSGNMTVNGGTLNLMSGATNTLLFNNGLVVNTGGTVDLKNGVQFIAGLSSQAAGANTDVGGGIVTNSGDQATLVVNGNTNFGGVIQGTIYLNKTGTGALNLTAAQTYTGDTLITGGTMTLVDGGTINTPNIGINYGSLTLTNTGLQDLGDRVNNAPITMRGGNITFNGRAQTNSTETLGAVILAEGNNSIFPQAGATGINSADLTLMSLSRSLGSTATLRFNNLASMGLIGSQSRVFITANPTLSNNIIGPWAIVDREYASYDATYGVGGLNAVGFAGYAGSGLNTNPFATDNIRHTTTGTTILSGNTVVNTLNLSQTTSNMILDLGGNTLRLQGGGLLIGQNTDSTSVTINNGTITSGTLGSPSDFFVTHAPFDNDSRAAAINAVIADNAPVTGPVRLILSAADTRPVASGLTLGGVNTYTGGTVLNQSTIILSAAGALGTGGITVNGATLVQTTGGVIPAQALTMNGGSLVTLAGANSLTGITFNNNGGTAPTLNPTGVLTLTGGITSNPTNPGTVSIISNGTLDLNAVGSYAINVAATLINGVDVAPWQAGLIINSVIDNGGIVKSGAGLLQLGGASTFAGGLTVNAGGLVIATDTNSLVINDPVVTGPVGTGTLTMAANTTMLAGGAARTITNNVTFLGDSVFNGTNNLTLNGITTLPAVWNATVTAPQMTVTIGDASPSLGTDVINKSGLGILTVGNYAGTINASGGLLFSDDGNTLGTPENVSLGGNLVITGDTAITVNRTGSGPNSRNKTLQKVDLEVPGNIMSVSNQSGYGLEFTGNTLMTGPSHFAVGLATASNVVQGLILSGVVDDGASTFGIIKSGPGALVLSGANTFGGAGQTIDILNGVVSVNSDAALGNAANTVTLNVDGSTGVGFRSTGTFTTGRSFILNQANNAFEVTAGNNLTLTTPFTLSAATNTLSKNDNGIFTINADNTGWTGAININAGALRAADPDAFGSGTVTINAAASEAALQLAAVTLVNPLTLNLTVNGVAASGINFGGAIQSVSGISEVSGAITVLGAPSADNTSRNFAFGADAGASLEISGGVTINHASGGTGRSMSMFLTGSGNGTLSSGITNSAGTPGTFVLQKLGSGTWTVDSAIAVPGAVNVNFGTFAVSGAGALGGAGTISVNAGATLSVNDTAGPATRLNNRALTIRGSEFIYTGNVANSAEVSTGALTFARMGGIFASNQTGAGTVSLTFGSLALGADASANFQGVNLGTAANRLLFTTAPTLVGGAVAATNGILARATVNGSTFATYNTNGTTVNTNGIQAFTGYSAATNINSAAATDTVDVITLTTPNLTATKTLNALRFSTSTVQTVGGAAFNQLVLTSGGILATGAATHTLSVPVLNNAAVQNVFHVDTGSTLNVTSTLVGTAGLVKDGAGTLILSPTNFGGVSHNTLTGVVTVAGGTLQLAGGTNTMAPNQFVVMGGPGSTLDLNGTSQQILGLLTDTANPGSGGIITSSNGTGQLVINNDNTARTWAGSINGAVNLVRSGQNTLSFASDNAYTGTTIINGNTMTLRDDGALSGTSAISINYATLSLENNVGFNGLDNRINDAAAITLRGGTINFQGRAQTVSTETLGAVTLAPGKSFINSVIGGTGINSADLTLTSLSRAVGGGTVNFTAATGGLIGSSSRILIPTINGTPTNTAFNALNDGILGGWAVIGTSDWASYVPGLGVGAMGQQGFPQYSNIVTTPTTLANMSATDNVNLNTASITSLVNDDVTVNSLRFGNVATNTVNIAAGKTLTLESGGLLFFSTAVQNLGAVVNQGNLTSSGPELFVYAQGTGPHNINSVITGANSLVKSGANTLNLAGMNTYTGGTTVNQGTLTVAATGSIPLATVAANGLVINNGTVTLNAAGAIAAGNIVTIRSAGSVLNLFGNNTLEGLVISNTGGGSANLQINTFSIATATGAGSTGVLSIGDSGIVANSENVSSSNIIVGRTDFGATAKTVEVNPLSTNGVATSMLNSTLRLQGIVGSTAGIIKTGNGVLQFDAQSHYTGPTTVNAGGIRTGVTNGGSRLSALTLNGPSTSFNIAGLNTTWGSLAGSGFVFSSGAAATLTVGFDDSSTTFSGQLVRFNDAVINGVALQKIGTGTMTMTSAQNYATGTTGTITVNGGELKYMDAGAAFQGTTGVGGSGGAIFNVNNGAILALDNTGTSNVNNRLGLNAVGTLNLQGGKLTINGSSTAATPTSEQITTFTVNNGGGRIELTPNASNPLTLAITTLSGQNSAGSLVVTGITGAASANGIANLTITNPTLIAGQGAGANGTATMSVRSDILADANVSGLGTGFLVRDSVTNNYRALGTSSAGAAVPGEFEMAANTALLTNWGATENVKVASAQTLFANTSANTLTFEGTSSIASGLSAAFGNYGPGGSLLTQNLSNAAGLLVLNGATVTIGTGALAGAAAGTTMNLHVVGTGTLGINGAFGIGNTGGIIKSDGGLLSFNNRAYYTGVTTINNGTLALNSGAANTLAVVPTAGAATVSQVNLNGTNAVLDLMGRNQAIGALTSVNPLPGNGGTVQNTGAAATLTNIGTGTFSGSITGNISFTRAGSSTTTLTNANTYTGATVVRGGVLELRDSGTLASTAGLMLNYGTLNWNNFGLNAAGSPNPTRIAATNAVTLQGGTFTINGAGSTDTIATLNSVTVTGGSNFINTLPYINQSSTVKLTIGNLVRNVATKSGVVFNGFTTNNSAGSNTLGGQGLTTNSNIFLTQVNGAAFSASNLVNNLIGGWAVADGSTFATYSNTFGVVAMGNVYGGFTAPAFTGTDLTSTVATGNYNDAGTGTTAITRTMTTGAKSANSWRIAQSGAATTITPVAGTTYSFGVGIITNNNQAVTIGAVNSSNTITGTGADLFFYINSNTTVVQPSIIGSAALISNGPATLSLRPQFASNTYSGGTFVNNGTTNLQAATGLIAIPGNLTITNGAVTMSTVPNQIAATSAVTINGGGTLTFANYTSAVTTNLASLTFNNAGGAANPTVALGTPTAGNSHTLILTGASPITSTNDSLATTPTISTGSATLTGLQFSDPNPVITVNSGLAETGLTISATITQNVNMLSLSKSGAGVLALSGASTFSTGFNLNQGGLMFGAGSTGTVPTITAGPVGTGTLTIAGGTSLLSDGTVRTIGNATTVNGDFTFAGRLAGNGVILSGAMDLGAAGRTITVESPAVTSTISGVITSTAVGTALTKAGNGTLVLSSATNSLGGAGVTISGGILKNGINNAIPNDSLVTINAGTGYDLNNFDQASLQIGGTGFVTNSGNATRTLTLTGTSATDVVTNLSYSFGGVLTDNRLAVATSALAVTKAGLGTLTLSGLQNNYFGATTIVAGSLTGSVDNTLSPNSSVIVGSAATGALTATLDVTATNQTIGGLLARNNNAAGLASVLIGAGKTLTVTGNVLIGSDLDTSTTLLTATGAGTLNVINPATGNNFVVGNHQGNQAEADFSGLATLNINVGGTVQVSSTSSTNLTGKGTMTLATTSTITASALTVGGGGSYNGNLNQINSLFLGAGVNTFNVNTINVGTGNRDFGSVTFDGPTGSLVLRAADGVSRAAFNMGTTGGSTGVPTAAGLQNTFDVTGHNADLLLGAVAMGTQATRGDTLNNVFSFDTGTLDMTSLTMSVKTGTPLAGTHIVNSTLNLGGGTVLIGNIAQMGQASTSDNKANATINVTGGNVTIGTGSGTAITMASAGTGTQATGLLNLTGGSTTVTGDIVKTGGAGTTSATVTVNGGLLDMSGKNIGTGASTVVLNAQSGTLQNLNELNGGAVLTKTTGGTLIMQGVNTYTGGTAINAGVLQVNSTAALGTVGEISFGGGTLQYTANNTTDYSGRFSTGASQGVSIDTNAQNVTFATALTSSGGTLAKTGAGTLILTASSSYSGTTTVNGGTLQVGTFATAGTAGLSGAGDVLVNAGGTLAGTGNAVNNTVSGSVILGGAGPSLAVMAPGDTTGSLAEQNARMNLGGSLTLNASSQLQFQLTSATYQDLDYLGGYADAFTYLNANPTKLSNWNTATPGDHDFINVAGGLTINANRADTAFGFGTVQLFLNSYTSPSVGDVFNLIDWVGALAGSASFNAGTGFSSGGAHGDFDLPTLTGGLMWDTSAFASYGVVVVVPEPGRALFLLLGLLTLAFRRRR